MLSEENLTKYSNILDEILKFKNTTTAIPPHMSDNLGNVTNAETLFNFLQLNIEDKVLNEKFKQVYKIINPGKL